MGFSVYAFASAQEFLSSPRLPETSCVIADVQMPGMSGVELQEYLIAHDHGMPVIFITAFPHERVRERAMKGGAVCFLSKPFDEPQLLECVERALMRLQRVDGRPSNALRSFNGRYVWPHQLPISDLPGLLSCGRFQIRQTDSGTIEIDVAAASPAC